MIGTNDLVPIYINAVSDDLKVRVVETLLWDRQCWPIPLYEPLSEAIEANAQEMAYSLLTDLEVHGMGRTSRYFTGRVDLWTESLQQKVATQFRDQFTKLLFHPTPQGPPTRNHSKTISPEKYSMTRSTPDVASNRLQQQQQRLALPQPSPTMIPIKIRLFVHGVRIHDDFLWDCSVPGVSPITFAEETLGKDLNLSDEAIVAVATTIAEQLNGKELIDNITLPAHRNVTSATTMDQRFTVANMAHFVTQHSPTATQLP